MRRAAVKSNISKQVEAIENVCTLDHTVQNYEDRISHLEEAHTQLSDQITHIQLKIENRKTQKKEQLEALGCSRSKTRP